MQGKGNSFSTHLDATGATHAYNNSTIVNVAPMTNNATMRNVAPMHAAERGTHGPNHFTISVIS